jgi:hypothetical protein
MNTSRLTAWIALAALTAGSIAALRSTHRRRMKDGPPARPEEVERWEGEGGGVPLAGSRTAASQVRTGGDDEA